MPTTPYIGLSRIMSFLAWSGFLIDIVTANCIRLLWWKIHEVEKESEACLFWSMKDDWSV